MSGIPFKDLIPEFETIEAKGFINQSEGYLLAEPGFWDLGKKREMIENFRNCPACFGAHLARLGKTRTRKCRIEKALTGWELKLFRESGHHKLRFYYFEDGAGFLARFLWHGKDYYKWFIQQGRLFNDRETVECYLRDHCGAPHNCFGWRAWPKTRPSKVLRRVSELNPELAEEEFR